MNRIVIDKALSEKLREIKGSAEVCDEAGKTLGQFIPAGDRSLYEQVKVPFTEQELDQFEKEAGGRRLAEILANLERNA